MALHNSNELVVREVDEKELLVGSQQVVFQLLVQAFQLSNSTPFFTACHATKFFHWLSAYRVFLSLSPFYVCVFENGLRDGTSDDC
ncbi:predicted protein [Botrytis cinerea T4]|uniref:Uncharacterized protein n=1 Tax=Botryotinia fuckeliana (strain T4) TaxID=999810 RepID=G2YZH9_BOTF4|nr:predicted protein [Botrytis cinerea T4]